MDQSIAVAPFKRSGSATPQRYREVAEFFARAGKPGVARDYWKKWEASVPDSVRSDPPVPALEARGELDLAERRYEDALRDFRLAKDKRTGLCSVLSVEPRHRLRPVRVGPTPQLPILRRCSTLQCWILPEARRRYERLAQLYEQIHDSANAVKYYQKVVALWKDADPVLQPRVRAARDRITALGSRTVH